MMGRLEPKHWAILAMGILTALAAMIGTSDHWEDVLKPPAVAAFLGQLVVLLSSVFIGAPQNPNLTPQSNPGRRDTDPVLPKVP